MKRALWRDLIEAFMAWVAFLAFWMSVSFLGLLFVWMVTDAAQR